MNKKYLLVTIFSYSLLGWLLYCLFTTESNTYVTMTSIFIPVLIGAIIKYDSDTKKKIANIMSHYIII